MGKIWDLEKICEKFRKKYNLEKKKVFSLKNKEKIKKNDIYKIAVYLFESVSSDDMLNDVVESKRKTWKKYIDYFQRTFGLKLPKEIPVTTALLCVCFILLLDNQYFIKEDEECNNYVKRIKKKVCEEKFTDLDYEEKNELLTYFQNTFELVDYQKFGIEITVREDPSRTDEIIIHCYIKNLKYYKQYQSVIEMLAEIEPYGNELYSLVSHLRMGTAMEKMVYDFEEYVVSEIDEYTKRFCEGLHDELASRTAKLFMIEDEVYADDVSKEVVTFFEEYVNKEFELFKQNLVNECKTYDFNPWLLIGVK